METNSLSKVYPYMTLSYGTKIEFLVAVWKKSKKCYLVVPISNTVSGILQVLVDPYLNVDFSSQVGLMIGTINQLLSFLK